MLNTWRIQVVDRRPGDHGDAQICRVLSYGLS